jgi:hypothetical protein
LRLRNIVILAVILAVLAGVFYWVSRPGPTTPPKSTVYVWSIEMNDIKHIEMSLPREGLSQSFIKIPQGDQFPWFFDDPQRSPVDVNRWGGGIPLLLSGPGAVRVISKNATEEKLAEFGLTPPRRMEITLTLEDGDILNINIGDWTPDGEAFYIQVPGSNDVCIVDYTWYNEMERLVKEPPYATGS